MALIAAHLIIKNSQLGLAIIYNDQLSLPGFPSSFFEYDYSENIIRNCCCKEITEERQDIVRRKYTSRSNNVCCDRIRRSAIFNWRTVDDLQKHIFSRGSLSIVQFFHHCFFHLWEFTKNNTSETLECAAIPILRLNAEAQITHGSVVRR